jgi:leucyl aminopeptidase (aminopeptidase T)
MTTSSLVDKVVKTCLRIGEKDRVSIFSWRHTIELAEEFALACQKAGAKTHIEVETDELYYQTVLDLPLEYVREVNPFSLALLDVATANIYISGPENPKRLKLITPERMGALVEGDKPYGSKLMERKIRSAQIALGYVTPQRAETYAFDYMKWKKNIQAAIDVDYKYIQDLGKKLGEMLEKASKVHITAANGTDLELVMENRPAHINDGVVDEEDIERGDVFTALPAGSVAVVPKQNSAIGIFVSDTPLVDSGLLIKDVRFAFREGRLASIGGGQNIDVLKSRWLEAKGDKDQASILGIGLNPKAQIGYTYNYIALGSITLGVGDNREYGGKAESNFGSTITIAQPSIELDGKTVIRNGNPFP